jgi:uncharacterized membrane protein YeaQ/YmgE (transglycosylase-associated protein family)
LDVTSLVVFLLLAFSLIGAVAGWLAAVLMRGGGFGLLGNIAVGVLGAFVGGFLFGFAPLSVEDGLIIAPIAAVLGATGIFFVVGLFRKA